MTTIFPALAVSGFAQHTAAGVTDTYQIGNKQIVIPSPNGFLEAGSQIPGEKIMFIYTYRVYEKEQDIAEIQQFSKQWLTRIIAANSNAK